MNRNPSLPKFRTRDLVIQELPDEVLIYDLIEHKAFCLNSTARSIMDVCDGEMSIDEALTVLKGRLGSSMPEQIVWMTVSQFEKSGLLDEWSAPVQASRISRRKVLKAGVALGVALPTVAMLVAPTAAAAQSLGACTPSNGSCNISSPNCCPGLVCVSGGLDGICVACTPLGSQCTFGGSVCCQGFCCTDPTTTNTFPTCNNNCIG